ncbi:hypothetical protein IFM89_033962 [Coptis chinensis]|uniref:Homeodomain-like superfamily protein n=1 Tax=Coptis chinensis TaxID=261450 RepID=A0A835HQN2_9MAGN|nr:hypothetical protein IFM89_033962 [Coptis chinensis]
MAETRKKNKISISEEDISLLLPKYSAATIITLLQEISKFLTDKKIDWNEIVKKTLTGITNAREYQMVWRHLAYRDTLLENVDNAAELLEDDSDLESELEAFPPVSGEALVEAAACVKVLLGSDLPSDSSPLNRAIVEAPLTINIPNGQACGAVSDNPEPASTQGKNITIPVSVQRQSVPTSTSIESLEGNGSAAGCLPARRKRKPWTEEEDLELIAAVQKCGERNWANILKGDFKGDRTASQLSQRWTIIRKRQASLNSGGAGNPANPQLTEAQLATRQAVSHALNMPSAACSVGASVPGIPSSSASVPSVPEDISPGSQIQQAPHNKLTALASGARIAPPSAAASLLKAAQSKSALHIRPGSGSLIKTSLPGATSLAGSRPNVHYIRPGQALSSALYCSPRPSIQQPGSGQQDHGIPTRPQLVASSGPLSTSSSNCMSQQVMPVSSSSTALSGVDEGKSPNAIVASKEGPKSDVEMKDVGAANVPNEFGPGQTEFSNPEVLTENQTTPVESLNHSQKVGAGENKQLPGVKPESSDELKTATCSTAMDVD